MTDHASAGESKSDRAYHAIKQRVEDGTYGPGYRLVLDQLARELSVSPVPVREAVRRLEAEGYLVFTRNHGARVASIDPDQFGRARPAARPDRGGRAGRGDRKGGPRPQAGYPQRLSGGPRDYS